MPEWDDFHVLNTSATEAGPSASKKSKTTNKSQQNDGQRVFRENEIIETVVEFRDKEQCVMQTKLNFPSKKK